jgi:MFS transporter, CP family, cyanate transporter
MFVILRPVSLPSRVDPVRVGWLLAGILLIALNLRIGITSLGSLLAEVSDANDLSPLTGGLISSLPVACFAVVGPVALILLRRIGSHQGIAVALAALTAGLALRVTGGSTSLLLGTLVACSGIALANVLLPAVVKEHFPTAVGRITGTYSAVLSIGAALAAASAVPIAHAAGSWRVGLGAWALVAAVALVAWLPHCTAARRRAAPAVRPRISLWRNGRAWAVTVLFACQSVVAYVVMSWLPSMYVDAGFDQRTSGLLLACSISAGVPIYFLAPVLAGRLRSQGHLIGGLTVLVGAAFTGLWLAPQQAPWLWAVMLGAGGAVFPVTLTLFALRARTAAGTAALSSMAQSVGYLLAAGGPQLVAWLRFSTGSWETSYALLLVVCGVQITFGYLAGRPGHVDADLSASDVAVPEAVRTPGDR